VQHDAIAVHDADDSHVVERDHPPDGRRDAREHLAQLDRLGGDPGDFGEDIGYGLSVDGRGFLQHGSHGAFRCRPRASGID